MAGGSLLWAVGKIRRRLLTASFIGGLSCLISALPAFGAGVIQAEAESAIADSYADQELQEAAQTEQADKDRAAGKTDI